ncbi:unnamed protein product [Brugia timori]|uniref:Cystatin domain-containing protein n=1 Tax=Brugia timori TaxID=42155 RepID=A0A0R3QM08_9BILA|nr:unnamed protein product [Brugia timori]
MRYSKVVDVSNTHFEGIRYRFIAFDQSTARESKNRKTVVKNINFTS